MKVSWCVFAALLSPAASAVRKKVLDTEHPCYRWPFKASNQDDEVLLRKEVLEEGYTVAVPPKPPAEEDSVPVSVGLVIEEIFPINEDDKEVTVSTTIDVTWNDDRLVMSDECKEELNVTENCLSPCVVQVVKIQDLENLLWMPTFKVLNLKKVYDRDLLYESSFAYVNGCDGRVGIQGTVKYTVSCPFDFKWYPFDKQRCVLTFFTPNLNDLIGVAAIEDIGDIKLKWLVPPQLLKYQYGANLGLAGNFEQRVVVETTGDGCAGCEAVLKVYILYDRVHISYYIQTIFPSMMLVGASFASLWIPSDQIPGRMTLSVTTTLTLMAMINSVFESAPVTSYLKAMDIWLNTCFVFTFAVLFEFCLVIALTWKNPLAVSRVAHSAKKKVKNAKYPTSEDDEEEDEKENKKRSERNSCFMRVATALESWFKLVLPVIFLVFLLLFFGFCLKDREAFTEREGATYSEISQLELPL